jgi:uncharacterized protein (TIGR02996 family)
MVAGQGRSAQRNADQENTVTSGADIGFSLDTSPNLHTFTRMQATGVEEALRAHPDNLALWRAYSDWLVEHGDTRGTLIRLEQDVARIRPADRPAAESEIAELAAEHESGWDDGLPARARVLARKYGFPVAVAVEWSADVREVVEQVLRVWFVTSLRITSGEGDEDEWDEDEWDEDEWDEDEDEREGSPVVRPDIEALAGLDVGQLTELDLSYLALGPGGAQTLAASLQTSRLQALDLRYCCIGDAGLAGLAACPHLGGLRRLHLQHSKLTAEGVRHLHQFPQLTELDLRYNDIGEAGAQVLLDAPFTRSLTRLWLYNCDVGKQGVQKMAQAPELPPGLRGLWRCM